MATTFLERLSWPRTIKSVKELGFECELAAHREAGSLQAEFRRIASGPEQRSAVEGPRKEKMGGGARACSGELDFKRRNGAAAGLERRTQDGFSRGCDRERLKTSAAGLLEFHGDDVPVRRKPRRLRLKRGDRAFAEFLKTRKRLGHGGGRFPAHQEGGGRRKPRRRIRLLGRINRRFDSPFLQAISVLVDGIRVTVLSARGNAEGCLRLLPEKHHNVQPRPRRASHKLQGFRQRPLRGRLMLPEIVRAGEWRQSKEQGHHWENRSECRRKQRSAAPMCPG